MTLAVKWSELGPDPKGASTLYSMTTNAKQGSGRSRQIVVAYSDLEAALKQSVGYSTLEMVSGTKYRLKRELPELWPITSMAQVYACDSCELLQLNKWAGRKDFNTTTKIFGALDKTVGDADGNTKQKLNQFTKANLKLNYKLVDYKILTDDEVAAGPLGVTDESVRFVSFKETNQARYFSVPGNTFYVIAGGTPTVLPYPVGMIESKGTLHLTWHQVAYDAVPRQTIMNSLVGKVNKAPFVWNGKTYAAGTLLCMAPQYTTYMQPNGVLGCDVEFILEVFNKEHNRIAYRKNATSDIDYYWITTDQSITTPPTYGSLPLNKFLFGEADFKELFNVQNP
jgi:hypothetical protein